MLGTHEVTFSPATRAAASLIAKDLRESDLDEMAAYGLADEVIRSKTIESWGDLPDTFVAVLDGEPVAIFGVFEFRPWMIASKGAERATLTLHKAAKEIVDCWKTRYKILTNYVSEDNTAAVEWLGVLGFQVLSDIEYIGAPGRRFLRFEWRA